MADTNTTIGTENAESLTAVATPTPQAEDIAPMVIASNEATTQVAAAASSAPAASSAKPGSYEVVVKAPPAGGMLAYLVGPGAHIVLDGIDLNKATMAQEGGNLRITLANGAEVLLLDYVSSAQTASTVVVTPEGTLPAQQLLAALEGTKIAGKDVTDVEPAAGPAGGGGEGGGLLPPTILGLGVGNGEGIFSSVIDPFAIPRPADAITTNEYPFEPGVAPAALPPVTPPANSPPLARNDSFSTAINKPVTMTPGQLLANDSDPDGDALTIVSVQGATHGTVAIVNGQVVFTPEAGFTGTGSYSYTITDGHGGTSTADVIIQIDPDAPNQNEVIAADDAGTVVEGRAITINVLSNDSDPEGDALVPGSVRIVSQPAEGTVSVNPDGTISFQSNDLHSVAPRFVTFQYEVQDARGAADTATVTIEIIPSANSVIAVDDTGEIIPAGASKSFNVTGNDVDPQGDSFHITSIVQPTRGSATFDAATGQIVYNSVPSAVGYTEVITYTITDDRGATDTATLTVRVEPVNNVSAVDDTADLMAGQDVNIKVLNNDFDQQGDTFRITRIVQNPIIESGNGADDGQPRGSVTINPDGTITFTDTPGARSSGVVEFVYEIVDSKGALDTAVVRVTIGTAANGVDANNDTLTLAQDAPRADVTATILANDFDPQGDAFSITSITQPTLGQGTVELVNGHVFFTPAAGYHGPVEFQYTITDALGATDTARVTISVQAPANTDLNAGDDNFVTAFNTNLTITPAQLLANDFDPEGTTLNGSNITSFTQPAHGTVTLVNGNYVYNPADTFTGTDTFTYTIRDAQGDVATATVTIRVNEGRIDNPVDANDDFATVKPGESATINALFNDRAPDGGLAFVRLVDPLPAGVTNLGNGVFRYDAPANTTGQTVSFRYEIRDADGDLDIATVTFKVEGPVNTVDARDDLVNMARAEHTILINAKANDVDPDGDAFSITRIVSVSEGTATIENGQVRFNHPTDYPRSGADYTIVYEVTDARGAKDTATITVHVPALDNTVDARDDLVNIQRAEHSVLIDAKANDVDPQGDAFSITRIVSVSEGTATIENGQVRFNHPADYPRNGADYTIVYEVTDSLGAKDTATITVHVPALDNTVVAVNDDVTMDKNVDTILINAKANDFDPQGDAFSITRIVSVSAGTATIENGQIRYTNPDDAASTQTIVYEVTDALGAKSQATITVHIVADVANTVVAVDDVVEMAKDVDTILINAKANDFDPDGDAFNITRIVSVSQGTATIENGQIRYTNPSDAASVQTIVYEITDALGNKDTATITINIKADTVNTVVAVDDVVTMGKDVDTILINAKANDFDPDGDVFNITRIVSVSQGTATIENGQIRYTNPSDAASTQTIVYEVTDALGNKDTATITVNIVADTINSVVAVDDVVTMAKDVDTILINAKANDFDPDGDVFNITRIVSVSQGTATIENGQIRYTNPSDAASTQTIVYEVTDALGNKDTATITINIAADTINSVVAVDDVVTMAKDVDTILINAKANDFDPDGDVFNITRIVSVSQGTATIENGMIRYTNANDAASTQTIVYEVTDALGNKDTATITVNIAADSAPNTVVAVDDVATMPKDLNTILINALANDFDPDGDTFSITRIVSVSQGTATVENGQIRYTNADDAASTQTIVYEITDSKGNKDTATITVKIEADTPTPVNTVVAEDDRVTMAADQDTILINAKLNDYDPQGDVFNITRIVSVSNGTATIENGQIRYTLADDNASTQTIVYEVTDAKGAKDTATITIDVRADTPNSVVAVNDSVTMAKDEQKITIDAKANDYDPQGDAFSITKIISVSDGKASIVNGKIVYENNTRDAGTEKIVYEITDSKGATSQATITVAIKEDSNSVIAKDDTASLKFTKSYMDDRLTSTSGSMSVRIDVMNNDRDPEGDKFDVTKITDQPKWGSVKINGDGTITYTASSTKEGQYEDTFKYQIKDKFGAVDVATVTVKVHSAAIYARHDGHDGNSVDPLTIDLNGDGIKVTDSAHSQAKFDLDGDGVANSTAWVSGSDDAILAFDRNANGTIDGINEVFGHAGQDGFSELRALEDSNNDGMLDASDANWSQLKLWLDANANGISEEGELHNLADFGVTSINLSGNAASIQYGDAFISHTGEVKFADGHTGTAGSVFYTNDGDTVVQGTAANDVMIYSSTADTIDGGQGFDTLKVLTASDIVVNHDTTRSIESIDTKNNSSDKLTINVDDVLNISDNGVLTVTGDAVDDITLLGNVTQGANVSQDGHTYSSYSSANGGTVLVELGLTVHTQENQH